jgi:hypothetical protein
MVKQWSTLNRFSLIEIILYFCATKIKYIMDTVKIIAFVFNNTAVRPLIGEVGITCTHVKHSHDHISSLRGDVWAHISHLTLPLFIDRSMPSQEREWSCTCLLVVLILLPLSTILLLDCGTGCSDGVMFICSSFYSGYFLFYCPNIFRIKSL